MDRGESSRIDGNANGDDAHPRASTRIDEQAYIDGVSLELIGAHARWIGHRDHAELRRALLALLVALEAP